MQKVSRKKLASIAVVGILLLAVTSYAILKYQEKITNTGNVIGYEVKLVRRDTNAIITTIPWGDIEQGQTKTSDASLVLTKNLTMKNTGDFDCYMGWKLNSTLPNGITLTCQYWYTDGAAWKPLAQNQFSDSDGWSLVAKNTFSNPVMWTLNVPNDSPRGAINFDILLLTATTLSG